MTTLYLFHTIIILDNVYNSYVCSYVEVRTKTFKMYLINLCTYIRSNFEINMYMIILCSTAYIISIMMKIRRL